MSKRLKEVKEVKAQGEDRAVRVAVKITRKAE